MTWASSTLADGGSERALMATRVFFGELHGSQLKWGDMMVFVSCRQLNVQGLGLEFHRFGRQGWDWLTRRRCRARAGVA